jgi:hypothetical protein
VATSRPRSPLRPRTALIGAACLLVAALSLLLPSAPTTDSWGWIVWGREIIHLELSTVVPGAPSWKPLPVLATTPLALAGGVAPSLWLLVVRVGALASLVVTYRLGERLAGRWAGLLAVLGLVLSAHWVRQFGHGYTEPLATGLLLGAVHCHLFGRPRWALLLGALVALARPEAWFLLVPYGVMLLWRRQVHPSLPAALVLAVPALWVVPDWIGSGDPMHASAVSQMVVPTGTAATFTALGEAALIAPPPFTLAALVGIVLALRRRNRAVTAIAVLVTWWWLLLTCMMFAGYPASGRFFVLPAALLCVLGAVSALWALEVVRRFARESRLRAGLAATLGIAAVVLISVRSESIIDQGRDTLSRSKLEGDLRTVVERSRSQLLGCGTPEIPNGMLWLKGVVAWELDLPLRRVRGIRTSASDFIELVSDPEGAPLPRWPVRRRVTVRARIRPFVLLSPFGDAPIRVGKGRKLRLVTIAAAGRWRTELPVRRGVRSTTVAAGNRCARRPSP